MYFELLYMIWSFLRSPKSFILSNPILLLQKNTIESPNISQIGISEQQNDTFHMPLQQYDDQYRPPIKRKKTCSIKADKELFQKYGITREELDIILSQLCEKYQQNWVTVSAALYQQHGIIMNSAYIKERYGMFLDPNLRKDGFTKKQEMLIIKMFCLEGATLKDYMRVFPNRDRLMFKNILHIAFRKAYYKLEDYLHEQLKQLPPQNLIRYGEDNVQIIVRALASQTNYQWKNNIAGYKILYFFVVCEGERLSRMPKEVALLFYKRMEELIRYLKRQRLKHYSRIDPEYHRYRTQQLKVKKKERNRRRFNSSETSSEARRESSESSYEVKKQQYIETNHEKDSMKSFKTNDLDLQRSRLQYSQHLTQCSDLFQGMQEEKMELTLQDQCFDIQFQ